MFQNFSDPTGVENSHDVQVQVAELWAWQCNLIPRDTQTELYFFINLVSHHRKRYHVVSNSSNEIVYLEKTKE